MDPEPGPDTDAVEPEHDMATVVARAVQDFERRLLRYAQSWLGNVDHARDVVQETFLQLHRQAQVQLPPSLSAWLYTVCRHRAIDWCRRQRRRQTSSWTGSPDMEVEQVLEESESPVESLIREERDQQIRDLLGGLTAVQRETVRLRFQGGLSYQEIAEVTGMTVNHVGVTLHTALQKLRDRLQA